MIAGLEDITSGTVRVGGQGRQRPAAEGPGHGDDLPELRPLPAHERLRQHGVRAEDARHRPGRDPAAGRRRRREILGLAEVLGKRPRHLSGGQRQRVAMGRAIVREPEAFLMDEPLSNLDAKMRVQMRAEIARIQRDLKVTTIYVTHDQSEAMTLGDRVCVHARRRAPAGRQPAGALRPPGEPVRRRASSARRR